jgi:hypothetical protein
MSHRFDIGPDDEVYQRARRHARRRPAWLLRRREARVVAARPRPTTEELVELRAIRQELRLRAVRPAPLRWWIL